MTALAFVPVGQLCGKLMERKSQLPAYGFNLWAAWLCFTDFLLAFCGRRLWCVRAVLVILLFFFVPEPRTLLLGMGIALAP